MSEPQARWHRVLLKLSGEAFAGDESYGIDGKVVEQLASEIVEVRNELDLEMAVVVGGGNIWRGMTGASAGMDRAQADYMGMLATVINSLALQDVLERLGQPTRVQSAITMAAVAGNPYFTTDTTAALRAVEIEAGVILRGTHSGVDGIYTDDPRTNPDATKLDHVTYIEVINQGLRAMDPTAVTLCMEHSLPIVVFDLMTKGNVRSILLGEAIGTLVQ